MRARHAVPIFIAALAVTAASPARASQNLTGRIVSTDIRQAVHLCAGSTTRRLHIRVAGFYRARTIITNGPTVFWGALFETDAVPTDAADYIAEYHGIAVGLLNTSPLAHNARAVALVRNHAHLAIMGTLYCGRPYSGLAPTAITSIRRHARLASMLIPAT